MPMKTIEGYSKEKYTNTSVLLAGGGAKALSDFIGSLSWDSTNKKIKYTPIGGSVTDLVTLSWDNIANKPTSLPANGGDADTVDNYHASNLTKFYLSPMSSGAPADSAKSWFIDTMPSASGAIVYNVPGSEKTIIVGKSSGAYGHMLQLNYDDNYLRILRYQSGSWKTTDWEKISAGYADSAGDADTVDGQHLITQVSDWNTDSLSIFKSSENSSSNAPTTDFLYGLTLRFHREDSTYHTDLVSKLYSDALFFRRKTESGYGSWRELIHSGNIGSQSVNYADSAGSVTWANITGKPSTFAPSSHSHAAVDYLYPHYNSGDKPNPQEYFNENIGVKVAMTRYANIGGSTAWHDTLWINGYAGSDVPYVTSLTFRRDGTPRFFVHSQSNRATSYGTYYEVITAYNIGSQHVSYADSADSVAWDNVTGKPSTFEPSSHNHDTLYPKKDGTGASGTWGIDITGSAGKLSLTSCYNGTTNNDLWSTIKSTNNSYLGTATIYEVYNDGGPDTYGEVLDIISVHNNHWQPQLWFGPGKSGRLRYRNKEYNDNSWGDWRTVAWTSDIPSVGNGTVTVTQAGSTIGSFTMNQGGNTLIALNDTNTNYYPIRSYTTGLQISSYSGSADCALFVPYATNAVAGAVSTAAQSFAGQKTFLNGIKVGSTSSDQSTDNAKIYFGDGKYVWIGESPQDDALMLNCGTGKNIYFSFAGSTAITSSNYSTYAKIYMSNSGAVYASSGFYESSDERLKSILNPVKVNLDDLSKLRKVYYLWKDKSEAGIQLGMIAQDVQRLYPELVSMDKETGYLSLAYDKLSVIALEAIDTLYEEYKQLKERINELEKLLHSKEIL